MCYGGRVGGMWRWKSNICGRLRKCIVVNEGTEAEEVRRMVIKIICSDLSGRN